MKLQKQLYLKDWRSSKYDNISDFRLSKQVRKLQFQSTQNYYQQNKIDYQQQNNKCQYTI